LSFGLSYFCSNFLFFIHAKFPRTSIKACRGANKHILALERDKKLFEHVLKLMAKECPHDNCGLAQLHVETPNDFDFDDDDDMFNVAPCGHQDLFCK
jgi:hypothetical protein